MLTMTQWFAIKYGGKKPKNTQIINNQVYMNLPDIIEVTIPQQTVTEAGYIHSENNRCYLERALDDAGFIGSIVSSYGRTLFGNILYLPVRSFNISILKHELFKGNVIVTLKKKI